MSIFTCYVCDGFRDADDGCGEIVGVGTALVCLSCMENGDHGDDCDGDCKWNPRTKGFDCLPPVAKEGE